MKGLGLGLAILQVLDEERKALGVSDEVLHRLAKPEGRALLRKLAESLVGHPLQTITKNRHGHYVITIVGRNFTGAEEISRLGATGVQVSTCAEQILKSDDYHQNHRLKDGVRYEVVIIPGMEIKGGRTTADVKAYAKRFGYAVLTAGMVPSIRLSLTNEQMEKEMGGIWYITGLHNPIKDSGGDPRVLSADRCDGGSWLHAYWDRPGHGWRDYGAFAFLVPQVLNT